MWGLDFFSLPPEQRNGCYVFSFNPNWVSRVVDSSGWNEWKWKRAARCSRRGTLRCCPFVDGIKSLFDCVGGATRSIHFPLHSFQLFFFVPQLVCAAFSFFFFSSSPSGSEMQIGRNPIQRPGPLIRSINETSTICISVFPSLQW